MLLPTLDPAETTLVIETCLHIRPSPELSRLLSEGGLGASGRMDKGGLQDESRALSSPWHDCRGGAHREGGQALPSVPTLLEAEAGDQPGWINGTALG